MPVPRLSNGLQLVRKVSTSLEGGARGIQPEDFGCGSVAHTLTTNARLHSQDCMHSEKKSRSATFFSHPSRSPPPQGDRRSPPVAIQGMASPQPWSALRHVQKSIEGIELSIGSCPHAKSKCSALVTTRTKRAECVVSCGWCRPQASGVQANESERTETGATTDLVLVIFRNGSHDCCPVQPISRRLLVRSETWSACSKVFFGGGKVTWPLGSRRKNHWSTDRT